jgi:hypothetical protein
MTSKVEAMIIVTFPAVASVRAKYPPSKRVEARFRRAHNPLSGSRLQAKRIVAGISHSLLDLRPLYFDHIRCHRIAR